MDQPHKNPIKGINASYENASAEMRQLVDDKILNGFRHPEKHQNFANDIRAAITQTEIPNRGQAFERILEVMRDQMVDAEVKKGTVPSGKQYGMKDLGNDQKAAFNDIKKMFATERVDIVAANPGVADAYLASYQQLRAATHHLDVDAGTTNISSDQLTGHLQKATGIVKHNHAKAQEEAREKVCKSGGDFKKLVCGAEDLLQSASNLIINLEDKLGIKNKPAGREH